MPYGVNEEQSTPIQNIHLLLSGPPQAIRHAIARKTAKDPAAFFKMARTNVTGSPEHGFHLFHRGGLSVDPDLPIDCQ